MRIGNYQSGLDISFTVDEYKVLDCLRVNLDIDPTREDKDWLKVTANNTGAYGISVPRGEFRTARARTAVAKLRSPLPYFGVETVSSWTPGPGVLYGHKPLMNIPLIIRRDARPRSTPARPGNTVAEHVNEAVKLINNFKVSHGDDLEISINNEGRLVVRLYVEFGK